MKKVCANVFLFRYIKLGILFIYISLISNFSYSQVQTLTPVAVTLSTNVGGMYVSFPVDYDSNPTKKYPLLVFMHGTGERGNGTTDISKLANTALPKYIKDGLFPTSFNVGGENFSFIVVCPQVKEATGSADNVKVALDYALSNYRVDEQRVYLTGLSLGGITSWGYAAIAKSYTDKLAALLLVCPGVDSSLYGNTPLGRQRINNLVSSNLPVWITTNSNDNVVTTWKQLALADSLNRLNISPPTKLTVFQATGHDAWTKTYNPTFKENGMNVYEWMLSYKKGTTVSPLPPVANAGVTQIITLPVNSVVLDGSKSTAPSSTIKSYLWTKLSGPASGTISSPSAASTNVTSLQEGTYEFQLLVTDNNGKTSTAKVVITVKPALLPPVANAGNAQTITLPANSVTLSGSASVAPSGTIATYQWSKTSGPTQFTISNTSSVNTTITGLVQGTYVFQLKVVDNNGNSSTANVSVIVNAAPLPPVAEAGDAQTISLPLNLVTLDGSASTAPAGNISKYEWSKISGPSAGTIANPASVKTSVTDLMAGVYEFQLKVTDNLGASSVDIVTITVKAAPLPPISNAGNNITIQLPTNQITLDGSGSSAPGGTITNYAWSKTSGSLQGVINDPGNVNTIVTGLIEGVYMFELKVTDSNGNSSISTITVTVKAAPLPPTANAGTDQVIILPVNSVQLDAGGSTAPSGNIVSYEWSKVSGPTGGVLSPINISNPQATGLTEGTYTFQVKVTDNNGLNATATVVITVKAAPLPPVSNAGAAQTIVLPQNSVTLNGSNSTAPSGNIVSYEWKKLSGGTAVITNAGISTTIVNSLTEGVYQFELKVTDNNGASATSIVTITVKAAPPPPVANAGNAQTIVLPVNNVTIDGSKSSAAAGNIVSYQWQLLSGPAGSTITEAVKAKTTVTNLVEGEYKFQLQVTDNIGSTATAVVVITVKAALVPPIANAGLAQTITLPVNTVTLNATLSTAPAGSIKNFVWTKLSGPSTGEITNPGSGMTTVTNLVAGVYQFQVKVIDNNNNSSLATVSVTVNPAVVKPPVANAGEDQVLQLPVNAIQLDGSKSYAREGSIKAYKWIVVSAPGGISLLNASTVNPSVLTVPEGIYTFRLFITDTYNSVDSADVIFTVLAKNTLSQPPVAYIQSDSIVSLPQTTIILDGSASYSIDQTIVKYEWLIVSGPSGALIEKPADAATTISSLTEGEYEFGLKVTDSKGNVSMSTTKVLVNNPGGRPDLQQSVQIYPNPAQNIVNIKLAGESKGRTMIDIHDANGKRVVHKEVIKDNSSFLQTIDISRLKKGVYFIEVIIDYRYRSAYKLIKL